MRYPGCRAGAAGATSWSRSCSRAGARRISSRARSTRARRRAGFVFFEGPPTANGGPGIHHVFARTIKDLFCRYRAMQGHHVHAQGGMGHARAAGGDRGREARSASAASRTSRSSASRSSTGCAARACSSIASDWEQLSERIGYWLDYDDPYVTYTNEYIESVWWALKTLLREGAAVSRSQDPAVLPALRHGAVEPRSGAGVRGRGRSERLSSRSISNATGRPTGAEPHGASASSCGRRRRGRSCRTWRSRCIRSSRTSSCGRTGSADWHAHPRRVARGARCSARLRDRWDDRRDVHGRELVGLRYTGRSTGCRIRRGRARDHRRPRTSCRADDGIRRGAHGAGVRRGRLRGRASDTASRSCSR